MVQNQYSLVRHDHCGWLSSTNMQHGKISSSSPLSRQSIIKIHKLENKSITIIVGNQVQSLIVWIRFTAALSLLCAGFSHGTTAKQIIFKTSDFRQFSEKKSMRYEQYFLLFSRLKIIVTYVCSDCTLATTVA